MPLGVNQHAWYGAQICHLQKKKCPNTFLITETESPVWTDICVPSTTWVLGPHGAMGRMYHVDSICLYTCYSLVMGSFFSKIQLHFEILCVPYILLRTPNVTKYLRHFRFLLSAITLIFGLLGTDQHGKRMRVLGQNPAPVKVYSLSHDVYMYINSAIHLRWCRNFLYLHCKTAKPSGSSSHIAHQHLLLASANANMQSLFLCYITIDIWYMLYIYIIYLHNIFILKNPPRLIHLHY